MLDMKIDMMSAWNLDSGPSIHAELVGREWVRMGHDLAVYSFIRSDFHGTTFVGEDESYVTRCFGTRKDLDPRPILRSRADFFLAQDLGMLPKDDLGKIFHHIKDRAKAVNIIHDAELSSDPSFYQFEWDAIVCFDERYKRFLREVFSERTIQIIPFPCRPLVEGDKEKARRKLGLPLGKKILLIFGQRVKSDLAMIETISNLGRDYPIMLLVVSIHTPSQIEAENIQVEVRNEAPPMAGLYDYLHASDALLLHRQSDKTAVVSSTANQCLGSGCPIVALDSPFFEEYEDEVLKYRNAEEFESRLVEVFEEGKKLTKTLNAAKRYVERNSSERVAETYLKLFQELQHT